MKLFLENPRGAEKSESSNVRWLDTPRTRGLPIKGREREGIDDHEIRP
jgi:hypothetical protein